MFLPRSTKSTSRRLLVWTRTSPRPNRSGDSMGLDSTGLEWFLLLALKSLFVLLPPSIIVWLITKITAHSLYLYGQRTSEGDAPLSYRFAVQNNEDIALSEHTLRIEILDEDGRFVDGPAVYAGCNSFTSVMQPDKKSWLMTFEELPAYDTWTIDCRTNAFARNVRLEIGEADTPLAGNTLQLAANQVSMLIGRTSTEWWWGGLALALGLVVYTFSTVFSFARQDWWFVSTPDWW